jgi:PAS domain S-box-containing protein
MERHLASLTASTAEPAFATNLQGTILTWNREAATLLGYKSRQAKGKRCYRLLAGTDLFGNSFCSAACPVLRAARRNEPLHRFSANLRNAEGKGVCVRVSALSMPSLPLANRPILHILEPCQHCGESLSLGEPLSILRPRAAGDGAEHGISSREFEVLRLIAQGKSTGDMSDALSISVATVRNHVQHLLDKLGAHSRLDAVCAARRQGML